MIKQRKLYLPKALGIWENRGCEERENRGDSVRKIDTPAEEQPGDGQDVNHPGDAKNSRKSIFFIVRFVFVRKYQPKPISRATGVIKPYKNKPIKSGIYK